MSVCAVRGAVSEFAGDGRLRAPLPSSALGIRNAWMYVDSLPEAIGLPYLPLLQSIGGGPSGAGVSMKHEHEHQRRNASRREEQTRGMGGKILLPVKNKVFKDISKNNFTYF